ncbi:putative integral membrane protein [Actinacidiphila reveromycinica]|uniref:Putative integral membrane protein n=1 Tax=Actinacidiphila reveromycinica TaxID=659352 RepID=A0A7U3UUW2_9ACTN|nr:hypothetical protein [Streptomyces sp. SN-593]BBA99176.1 putative integral membrane protein [Streptomyces sp. SN-593]
MNDFHGSDRPYGVPADGDPGLPPAGQAPAEGFPPPPPPADGYAQPYDQAYSQAYGYAPPSPAGWADGGAGAPAQGGYGRSGHPQPGYDQAAYPQPGYAQGGYAQAGYDQAGYEQPGYEQPGYGHDQGAPARNDYPQAAHPQAAHPQAGDPYGTGAAPGGGYVPEPFAAQQPQGGADPGAGYGGPPAGGAWEGQVFSGPPQTAQPAADPWAAAPAAAPAWGTTPGGAPGYAPGQDAGPGAPYGRQPAPAPRHAPDVPATGIAPAGHAPTGRAAAGHTPAGREQEPELERTAALPVVELEESAAPPHRTGSPIIPPGIQPAGLTAALGLLLAGGAAVGKPALAVLLVVLQAVTAAGWFRLNGMWPARQGIVLAFLSGVTVDIAVLAVSGGHGPVALLGTLGVWLLLVLVLQLRHHGSADERLSSLTATSASTLLTVVAGGYLLTATSHAGTDPVVVGTVAVAAATLVRAPRLPGGEPVSLVAALAVAAVTGALTGPATGFGTGHSVLLAAAAGACALVGLRVASYDWPSRFVHFTAGVALPLTAAAPVVYALGAALS